MTVLFNISYIFYKSLSECLELINFETIDKLIEPHLSNLSRNNSVFFIEVNEATSSKMT